MSSSTPGLDGATTRVRWERHPLGDLVLGHPGGRVTLRGVTCRISRVADQIRALRVRGRIDAPDWADVVTAALFHPGEAALASVPVGPTGVEVELTLCREALLPLVLLAGSGAELARFIARATPELSPRRAASWHLLWAASGASGASVQRGVRTATEDREAPPAR